MQMIEYGVVILIGLAGGIAVGGGYVAFLAVLGVIPRLAQLTRSGHRMKYFEWAVIIGTLTGSWCSLKNITFQTSQYWLVVLGIFCGTFVGMLAAALTEVLNVLPILAKRVGVDGKIVILLVALVLGKVIGSLFHWIYFVK
ncbi:stage V sporulation AB family protein [Bacillus clarus]|uniref:Stage V sporulation AB family protein n=2 Tax=Bacillus clarus TaxID=2338372 RepID=A0A090YZJ0_9BACI|nr:stage V sporulation AB family protein [Bacillus clarus]